jgi:membrane associated rhomboid family serine protease
VVPLRDRNPTSSTPWMTILLIVVNVGVFLLVQHGGTLASHDDAAFVYEHAAVPCELTQGRPITFVEVSRDTCIDHPPRNAPEPFRHKNVYLAVLVSMFLHGGWLHIGGNMLFLWIFGNNIEDKLGPLKYLAFYLVGGAVATAAQVAFDPGSTVPLIGASGAIAAVMGAYLVWFPKTPILTVFIFFLILVREVPAWLLLVFWFGLQFVTGPNSDVAYMAHVGGFAFGAAMAFLLRNTDWWRRRASSSPVGPGAGYLI